MMKESAVDCVFNYEENITSNPDLQKLLMRTGIWYHVVNIANT